MRRLKKGTERMEEREGRDGGRWERDNVHFDFGSDGGCT